MLDIIEHQFEPADVAALALGEAVGEGIGQLLAINIGLEQAIPLPQASHLERQIALLFKVVECRDNALARLTGRLGSLANVYRNPLLQFFRLGKKAPEEIPPPRVK